jgi:hypothetical protein
MTLREQRCKFGRLLPRLLDKAIELGYEVAPEEIMRSQSQAAANAATGAGVSNSLHLLGLAVDLNLYLEGTYITDGTGHSDRGGFWKSLDGDCRWGGDFKSQDFNHYSLTWEGRA